MDCISVTDAEYLHGYRLRLRFNTGETGEVDLKDIIFKFNAATPLRDPAKFAQFHLDEWPTLAWDCGFDLDPEYLYEKMTGKNIYTPQNAAGMT